MHMRANVFVKTSENQLVIFKTLHYCVQTEKTNLEILNVYKYDQYYSYFAICIRYKSEQYHK